MPRRRWIDPSFWEDPDIGELTPVQRLFFIGCFSNADDEGRLYGNAAYLRKTIFGYDDITLEDVQAIRDGVLVVMSDALCLYEQDGREYLAFRSWNKHQKPNYPKESKLPPPPEKNLDRSRPEVAPTSERQNPDDMGRVGLGRVGLDRIGAPMALCDSYSHQWGLIKLQLQGIHDRKVISQLFNHGTGIKAVTDTDVVIQIHKGDSVSVARMKPRIRQAIAAVCPEWAEREVVLEEA